MPPRKGNNRQQQKPIHQSVNHIEMKGADEVLSTKTTTPKEPPRETRAFTKRIGSANYRVNVHEPRSGKR